MRSAGMNRLIVILTVAGVLGLVAAAFAQGLPGPLNDLFAVGQGGGETPPGAPTVQRQEPAFVATPAATTCAPGSRPQPGVDGRVPAGAAKDGLWCNAKMIGHQGTEGGFRVYRYTDVHGRVCGYYDQTLMFPLNAFNPGAGSEGVAVLDMSNPTHPVKTDDLTTTPMLSPHESLNINQKRGLLAAVNGNLTTEPGFFSIYDIHEDCRHPVLDANGPYARFGHESGFTEDGKTYYATSTALKSITAIDVTNPKEPHAVWQGNVVSHGMSLSKDGNRGYIADPGGNLLILDTSQVQARRPDPQTREISRLTWKAASIPQNAIPFTENGHPYLLEIDEYTQGTTNNNGDPDMVGAARIIDIADETKPFVAANLRLAVDQPAEHKQAADDPGASSKPQGYAAHYCNIPTDVNPKVVACSFIASGLRVFDISDIVRPKEVAYFVAPATARSENGYDGSNFAMSQPTFAPGRQIWWSNGTSGFYVVQVDKSVWPENAGGVASQPAARVCKSGRRSRVKVRVPHGAKVRSVRATLGGKRVRTKRGRRAVYALVDTRGLRGTKRLVVRVRLTTGHRIVKKRPYRACAGK